MNNKTRLFPFIWLLATASVFAQTSGIQGVISDEQGNPLPFATIFVKQLGSGTTANADGFYEILLNPGRYELVFQFLGRRSEVRVVDIGEQHRTFDVTLVPQEIMLPSVTVNADDEDPAYSIMRKAIAKANYHRNVLDAYSARVYIKGAGRLKDYPWLAKKALKKEGIEKDRVYISESVSEIRFTRPSYTIHTLVHLGEKHPDKEFTVIIGQDNLVNFPKWKNHNRILEDYGLYVYPRPNAQPSELKTHPNVKFVDAPMLDISATFIRTCIRNRQSVRYLVPDPVEEIIRSRGYYLS
jgi:nicotinate (nicotinamide) nucleotide adenylyltransferase